MVPRVSTQQQGKPDKVSIQEQLDALQNFAHRKNFRVVAAEPVAFSGAKEDAPHLQKLRLLIRECRVEVVCFFNHDRAFRDELVGLQFLEHAARHGVDVYFGSHRHDPESPEDQFSTVIQLGASAHRRRKLRAAALAKHAHIRRSGRWYGTRAPLGYLLHDDRTLEPDKLAPLIAQLFHDLRQTPCFLAITMDAAQALGLDHDALHALIQNPVYRGIISYGKQLHPWEPYRIVSDETWHQAQKNLHSRRPRKRRPNLLASLAKELGNAGILDTLLDQRKILCTDCDKPVHRNGVVDIRGMDVPKVRCENGHEHAIVGSRDIQDLQHLMACWECGERRMSRFTVSRPWKLWWVIQCKRCGWKTRTLRNPFRPNPQPSPGTRNQSLGDFGLKL